MKKSIKKKSSRREFIKKSALGTAGLTFAFTAKSYGNILGSNERVNMAVAGLNGRGGGLTRTILKSNHGTVAYLCDVDRRAMEKVKKGVKEKSNQDPKLEKDFRKILEQKDVDALVIAAPDHWHTPMSIQALQAGKHVYVEKPCGHNGAEGEMLVAAQRKYGKVVQMGNQQRSAPTSIQAMKDIKEGIIGDVYYAKAWYANKRGGIGRGKAMPVPEWLDWELWQGPAPRVNFQDIFVHYNWHWFWNWGTGEVCNNGTHEIDICRWALGVDYPTKVSSTGGRFHYNDDWEFYDTQSVSFEFEGGKALNWEGRSCNNFKFWDRGRGSSIHGTKGTIVLDRNKYIVYDQDNKVIKEMDEKTMSATMNTVGEGGLDVYHMNNFTDVIREGVEQNSPILEGHKSVVLCHLGNIAQKVGRSLKTDPTNGHILKNRKAMKMWGREYEKGWNPKEYV